MNEQSKETDKSNNESEYILFPLKNNNFFKNNIQDSAKKSINNSNNNNNKNNSPIKFDKTNINFNKDKNLKSPFTNLILKEKIESDKLNNFLSKGDKLKLKMNNRKKVSNNNSTKDFLIINRFETIVSKNSKINENDKIDKNTLYKEKNDNKIQKNNINKSVSQKTKMVSTGQQTFIDMDFINKNNKNIEVKFNFKNKKNAIINIPIRNKLTKNYSSNNGNSNFRLNYNFEKNKNNSSIIYIPIPQIKLNNEGKENNKENKVNNENNENYENKEIIKNNKIINNFINSEHFNNYSKANFDSLSINEFNYHSVNDSNYKINKTQRLIKNRSNIVSFDDVQLDEKKNIMSIRELYRQMISAKEKEDKKKKFILKKNKIKNCLKKKNEEIKKKYKIFNSKLISLEQYTLDRINKKKSLNNKIKINNDFKRKIIINNKNSSYYINKFKPNAFKNTKKELNENIFTNILRSLSIENNKINNIKLNIKNNNKRSQINILTMIELNDKKKNIIKK